MLETVDFSLEDLPKDAYKRRHDQLTDRLVVLQQEARNKGVGLVVLFEGWNGAGKGSRISDLMYHLDARATSVHVTENLDVEAARSFAGTDQGVTGFFPVMQEFWKALGPRGDITFYDRGWYTAAMQQVLYNLFGTLSLPKGLSRDHVLATLGERRLQAAQAYVDSIADFERQLSDDGYVVVKFFVHMTKKGQKKRLMRLHDDPATRWRVSEEKLARIGNYEEAYALYDRLLEDSDFEFAPWTLLNGEDKRRTNLTIASTLVDALENERYQKRVPLMVMYEGWDAAGKGGNIKRVAQALDARAYTIFPSPAPTRPELLHPHLWRYWTRLPKAGHVGIYDRSWYGRVLVERVEGFASVSEWTRAYDEINEFERDLVRWGAILLKFWVDVSPEEQLRRFRDREQDPAKQWKITDEDWRNRDKYPQYKAAIEDMFRLTSTTFAPWTVLESDDKRHARVKALEIIVEALEARLHETRVSGTMGGANLSDRARQKRLT